MGAINPYSYLSLPAGVHYVSPPGAASYAAGYTQPVQPYYYNSNSSIPAAATLTPASTSYNPYSYAQYPQNSGTSSAYSQSYPSQWPSSQGTWPYGFNSALNPPAVSGINPPLPQITYPSSDQFRDFPFKLPDTQPKESMLYRIFTESTANGISAFMRGVSLTFLPAILGGFAMFIWSRSVGTRQLKIRNIFKMILLAMGVGGAINLYLSFQDKVKGIVNGIRNKPHKNLSI